MDWLKLGDIKKTDITNVLNNAFENTTDYNSAFVNYFISKNRYRYMFINNEHIVLDYMDNISQVLRPKLYKILQTELQTNPEFALFNHDLTNKGTLSNTQTGTNSNTQTLNTSVKTDTNNTNTTTYGKTDTQTGLTTNNLTNKTTYNTSDEKTGTDVLTQTQTGSSETVTTDTRRYKVENTKTGTETNNGEKSNNEDTTSTSNTHNTEDNNTVTHTENSKSGVRTVTDTPCAQVITKTITTQLNAPQSLAGVINGVPRPNGSEGVADLSPVADNLVYADNHQADFHPGTPLEVDSRHLTNVQENVSYPALARDENGNYKQNITTETFGQNTATGIEPLQDNTKVTLTLNDGAEHNNETNSEVSSTGKVNTKGTSKNTLTFTNRKDTQEYTGSDTTSNNLKVKVTPNTTTNNQTVYNNTNSKSGDDTTTNTGTVNVANTNTLSGKDINANTGTVTSTNTGTVGNQGTNNTTTNSVSEYNNKGFTVDRSVLTESFINLLKNDGIFDWFLKQYEEVFSPSFCMDSREYEDVKQ